MTSLVSITLVVVLGWGLFLGNVLAFDTNSPVAALPGTAKLFAGSPPTLGIQDSHLAPCPQTPNCVSSQATDSTHTIAPLAYQGSSHEAYQALIRVLGVVPRTKIIEQQENYIRAESQSRLLGFVDDLEFYFPADSGVIQVRSSARLGESDLGVNRRRLEQIRLALQDLGV
ncbi:DUF1499 domain-containing protein [Synechocystis sp. LKSZ1]|uniref:DUF1499 domain-containing protein n=1 Tax=Synechocystis sp. LKSZ1 TaxID=3144951 RepID=UPI00336BFE81